MPLYALSFLSSSQTSTEMLLFYMFLVTFLLPILLTVAVPVQIVMVSGSFTILLLYNQIHYCNLVLCAKNLQHNSWKSSDTKLGSHASEACTVYSTDADVGVVECLSNMCPHRLQSFAVTTPRSIELSNKLTR